MRNAWSLAALQPELAVAATLLAIWVRVATVLAEIVVETVAQLIIGDPRGARQPWASRSFKGD
jgi:hypothetical protein